MIPRRKLPIRRTDVRAWLRALFVSNPLPGKVVADFESEFARYLGCKHARAAASGRDALELAFAALDIKAGDELIIPAYTLGELLPLIRELGIIPVPVDIEKDSFNLDVSLVPAKISPKTKGILATHLLGAPCDIEAICSLAHERNFVVIEDCAHALGAHIDGRKMGTFGDAAIFSFEASKALPTYGGGMLVTNRPEVIEAAGKILAERAHEKAPALKKTFFTWIEEILIRSPFYAILARILFHGSIARKFERFYRGSHDRLRKKKVAYCDFQAGLGLQRLWEVDERNARMNQRWNQLAERLPAELTRQQREKIGSPAFYNFVALSEIDPVILRPRAIKLGVDIGIGSEVEDDCARILGFDDCRITAEIFNKAVMLPLYEAMSETQFHRLSKVTDNLIG